MDFLDIIRGFQEGRLEPPGVIAAVCQIFKGREDLVQGFNSFLPDGYRMPLPQNPSTAGAAAQATGPTMKGGLQMTDAIQYMDAVRDTFSAQPDVYVQFLDIMKGFQARK